MDNFKYINKNIKDIKFKSGLLVGAIKRNDKIIIPSGNDLLLNDDILFVLSQNNENIEKIDDICI